MLINIFNFHYRCIQYTVFNLAGWQSGYAAACKAVYAGSIPASASKKRIIIIKVYRMPGWWNW